MTGSSTKMKCFDAAFGLCIIVESFFTVKCTFVEFGFHNFVLAIFPFRKNRLDCFLNNVDKIKWKKRPSTMMIEKSKKLLKLYFLREAESAVIYVEDLYRKKYNRTLVITR